MAGAPLLRSPPEHLCPALIAQMRECLVSYVRVQYNGPSLPSRSSQGERRASKRLAKGDRVDQPKPLMRDESKSKRTTRTVLEPARSWAVLGWVGVIMLVVGGSDFALTWYPASFGNHEWEFGTVTASFNGLPILVMATGLILASSLQTGRRWLVVLATIVAFGLALWILAGVVLWATNIPLALRSVPESVLVGMKKSLAKTLVQSVTYPIAFAYLGIRGLRGFRGR